MLLSIDVKDKELGVLRAGVVEGELALLRSPDEGTVTLADGCPSKLDRCASSRAGVVAGGLDEVYVDLRVRPRHVVGDALARRQNALVDRQCRVDGCRSRCLALYVHTRRPSRCDDAKEVVPLLGVGKVPGKVLGWEAALGRAGPDLQEVNLAVAVGHLAMCDTSTRGGELDIATLHDLDVAHGVAVLEGTGNRHREDFEFAVRMCSESFIRCHSVFVEDAQAAELHKTVILVTAERCQLDCYKSKKKYTPCEGPSVERLEPAVVGVTTLMAGADDDLEVARSRQRDLRCHCRVQEGLWTRQAGDVAGCRSRRAETKQRRRCGGFPLRGDTDSR